MPLLCCYETRFKLCIILILCHLLLTYLIVRHGYGRWQAIVDDNDLRIQEVMCLELNLPFINLPVQGQAGSQVQTGANATNVESTGNQTRGNGFGNWE